jgi:predicted unusual protein kinase regulating ubiquinone biosynthesis (AarF/ABC1/UbiB family)
MFAHRDDMRFPRVRTELSSKRVLTSTWIEGRTIAEGAHASSAERDRWSATLWSFYQEAVVGEGLLHADPQPGNFVLGDGYVGFLDFGRVQQLSPRFLESWRGMMRASLERDPVGFRAASIGTGAVPHPERYDFEHGWRGAYTFYRPWLQDKPFTFTPEYVQRLWSAFASQRHNHMQTAYTRDMAFMHQFYFGLAGTLARLRATVSCRPTMLRLLYGSTPPPPPFSDEEIRLLGQI